MNKTSRQDIERHGEQVEDSYAPVAGVVSGVMMGPIFAWVLFLVSGILHANERRPCPHCREWTDPKATVCHHCGRGIAPVTPGPGGLRLVHSRRE